jgi:toxin HigB-1
MIRSFDHKGLERFFTSGQIKGIRAEHAKRLKLIMASLHAATRPMDMNLPGRRFHAPKGELAGFFAVNVSGNWRVIFRFQGGDAYDVGYVDYH